jgi:hypothetical protein
MDVVNRSGTITAEQEQKKCFFPVFNRSQSSLAQLWHTRRVFFSLSATYVAAQKPLLLPSLLRTFGALWAKERQKTRSSISFRLDSSAAEIYMTC